uniref:Uncharacterized protein n=1 Tax=Anolis carolinensis TaxID=28377 RepID=A0A803SL63_ANOCA
MGVREFPNGTARGKTIAIGMRRSPDVSPRRLSDISPQLRQLKYLVVDEAIKEDLKWSRSVEDLTSVGLTSIEERILRITGYYGYQPWAASYKSKALAFLPFSPLPKQQLPLLSLYPLSHIFTICQQRKHSLQVVWRRVGLYAGINPDSPILDISRNGISCLALSKRIRNHLCPPAICFCSFASILFLPLHLMKAMLTILFQDDEKEIRWWVGSWGWRDLLSFCACVAGVSKHCDNVGSYIPIYVRCDDQRNFLIA